MAIVADVSVLKRNGEPFTEALQIPLATFSTTTTVNTATYFDKRWTGRVLVMVKNGTDQSITVDVKGSDTSAFTNEYDPSLQVVVASGVTGYIAVDVDFPFIRFDGTPAVTVTSGNLDFVVAGKAQRAGGSR